MLNYSGWWFSSHRFFNVLRGGLLSNDKCQFFSRSSQPTNGAGGGYLEESHWRSPDSSTEVSYLSVLKNNVSDTRGLNFYCRRFLSLQENCTRSIQTPQ